MSKHTPTPWRISPYSKGSIIDADGVAIASSVMFYRTAEEAAANAAHIVYCVNTYPDLVKALETIAAFQDYTASEHLEETGSYSMFDDPQSVKIARAALAKAKVK